MTTAEFQRLTGVLARLGFTPSEIAARQAAAAAKLAATPERPPRKRPNDIVHSANPLLDGLTRLEYSRRANALIREKRLAKGLTTEGNPRQRKQHPKLRGLSGPDYHREFMRERRAK